MKKYLIFMLALAGFLGCIGDDIVMDEVPETVRILNKLDTIALGEKYQFEAMFTNNIGMTENRTVVWASTNATVLSINESGLGDALAKGTTTISATVELDGEPSVTDQFDLVVDENTVANDPTKMGQLKTTSSYTLRGDFTLSETNGKLIISLANNYQASTALPGLYVYLGNNPSSLSGAKELQKVTVFSGAHTYEVDGTGINDFQYLLYWCKPFNVKVGEGRIE